MPSQTAIDLSIIFILYYIFPHHTTIRPQPPYKYTRRRCTYRDTLGFIYMLFINQTLYALFPPAFFDNQPGHRHTF